MKIDAHQHFWQLNRGDYGWLTPEMPSLYHDFMPSDLRPHLRSCNIEQTVVVQAAPTVAETEFLLEMANRERMIAGVVGWLDFSAATFVSDYQRLRQHPKFVGLRPMLQDLPKDDWVLQDKVVANLAMLAKDQFPVDILVFPRHLPYVIQLLERIPTLRAVIDHLAKPTIKDQILEPWQSYMATIAGYPSVMCKLSGMMTEARRDWHLEHFRPYVDAVLQLFGPRRLMFGSDWPVCTDVADYTQVHDTIYALLAPSLSEDEINFVFGENAKDFYRLGPSS